MRWLQWSRYNLSGGLGGVEVHARCLDRELRALGVHSQLSSDPRDLKDPQWDVIHTHGSSPTPLMRTRATRVHTLHGTTIGRMSACGEWLWPGGYLAYGREWEGVVQAQVVVGVHSSIHLLSAAKIMLKRTIVCGNGWDSGIPTRSGDELSPELERRIDAFGPFICFVGRGNDPVKNTGFLAEVLKKKPNLRLVTIPGSGFPDIAQILKTGPLEPAQVLKVLRKSCGLALTSHYEGLPLVALEALGDGVTVFAPRVGGLVQLSSEIQGLQFLTLDTETWEMALTRAVLSPSDPAIRAGRAGLNRMRLPSWRQVTEKVLSAVRTI
jgi:glycosyltransferase involved in cell wall biosynthesis